MTESEPTAESSESESPTSSWEAVPEGSAPSPEPAAVEAPTGALAADLAAGDAVPVEAEAAEPAPAPEPVESAPTVAEPAVPEPALAEPVVSQPVASQPLTSEPVVPGPAPAASSPSASRPPADRPEIAIGGAFAGGLVLALILKRLAR